MAIETGPPLLEREHELAALHEALAAARDGRGRCVLLEAPAGLGKTSLLSAAGQAAANAGMRCLRARAGELERDFAYGCVRQLLEPAVGRVAGPERERLLAGAAALAEPVFAPAGVVRPPAANDAAFAVLHGLYWLVSNLADDGSVALLVDDLHWCDAETLRFLNYLAPRLDGLPVVVVATARTGAASGTDLARLAHAPETLLLRPAPLSLEATAALCARRLGPQVAPEFAAACRQATEGNPFFLEALLREAGDQTIPGDAAEAARVRRLAPVSVAQAVLLRLSGAPPAATALVRAVAVLGDGARLAEAARLAEVDEAEAARVGDLLVTLAILRPAEGLEFAHAIVREAVYADLGTHERAVAHARAATILAAAGASDERVAAQLAMAEPAGDPERVTLLRHVGAEALACGAPAAAVASLRRALAEPPPADAVAEVLLELGSAELRFGAPEAIEHLRGALEQLADPPLVATAARQLANAQTVTGNPDGAVEALDAAIAAIAGRDKELTLILEGEAASHALQASPATREPAAQRLERHGDLDGTTPGERLVLASRAFQRARASSSAAAATAHLEAGLAGGRFLREQELDIVGPFYDLAIGLLAADALDQAETSIALALEAARRRASVPGMAYLTSRRGWVALRRGALGRAEADARTALGLLDDHGLAHGRPLALALLTHALTAAGDVDAAAEVLAASGLPPDLHPSLTTNFLLEARGLVQLARGETRAGLEATLELGRRDELWGGASPLASRWRSRAALALATLGDGAEARRLAAEDLERARRWGTPRAIGIALRAQALVEAGGASPARLAEAVSTLEGSPARLELAQALIDLGAALRRANQRAEARRVLERGRALATACGARGLAGEAASEIRAAGGRTADPTATGVEQLTASERRVAELAADGHSNPEIAQTLFVTRKTVETHLGHVYRKLGVSGRGKLARALAAETASTSG